MALEAAAAEALGFDPLEPAEVALALARARGRVAIPGHESPSAYVVLSDVARRAGAPGEAEDALNKALALVDTWPDGEEKAKERSAISAKLDSLRASRPR